MIDLHSHILPGIDDGAESLEVSIAMLDAAATLGISTIVATPHLTNPLEEAYLERVSAALEGIRPLATDRGIELLSGYEVRLSPDLPSRLREGEPITLAGSNAVLVDLGIEWPAWADDTLYNMAVSGFLPILAHPERYPHLERDPARALALVDQGVAMQLTIAAFAGLFGRRARRVAESMLRRGTVHIVATDAHSTGSRLATVPAGLQRMTQLVGDVRTRQLTTDAPAAVIAGTTIPSPSRQVPMPDGRSWKLPFRMGR